MPQVINAVSKNANFIMFHEYEPVNDILSAPITSIPISEFSHRVDIDVNGVSETLSVFKSDNKIISFVSSNGIVLNIGISKIINGSEDGTMGSIQELCDFFLLP